MFEFVVENALIPNSRTSMKVLVELFGSLSGGVGVGWCELRTGYEDDTKEKRVFWKNLAKLFIRSFYS